ncbi:MAG: AEC family transporter [Deinococcales bacterium]
MLDLFGIILNVVLPTFLVIGTGAVLQRAFRFNLAELNRLALYGAVPALVFKSLMREELNPEALLRLIGSQLCFYPIMFLLALAFSGLLKAKNEHKRGMIATAMFPNSANIMLPVTLFAFGEAARDLAAIMFSFSSLMLFSLGPIVLSGGKGKLRSPLGVLKMPVIWAVILGLTLNLNHISLPQNLMRSIGILADAAIPLVLLALGMQMYQTGFSRPRALNILSAAFKLLIGPILCFGIGYLLGLRALELKVFTLWGAMPPAINTFMLALEFEAGAEEVGKTVMLATASAFFTIALVLRFLQF